MGIIVVVEGVRFVWGIVIVLGLWGIYIMSMDMDMGDFIIFIVSKKECSI